MAANYAKLWKLLIDKNINKTTLREISGISTGTLAKLGKNDYVSTEVLEKICRALQCDIGDVIEFVENEEH
ncbi:MAG: helix-turn-helix transcriptional regulator [Paenibacillus sp.]|uniref:helix-turn-helix domain-containing protein n=1 Tax=Paenibacillus sp. TaxID=58172 RepID=UPI0025F0955E|nr:helix-turn-helix transcriptional regulator [Paenibacillus sp.]MBR2565465.1 helix-turn-helix transcriptional regulator [Paenibacillus sp.]